MPGRGGQGLLLLLLVLLLLLLLELVLVLLLVVEVLLPTPVVEPRLRFPLAAMGPKVAEAAFVVLQGGQSYNERK